MKYFIRWLGMVIAIVVVSAVVPGSEVFSESTFDACYWSGAALLITWWFDGRAQTERGSE